MNFLNVLTARKKEYYMRSLLTRHFFMLVLCLAHILLTSSMSDESDTDSSEHEPGLLALMRAKQNLDETRKIMGNSLEVLLEREGNLNDIVENVNKLNAQTQEFQKRTAELTSFTPVARYLSMAIPFILFSSVVFFVQKMSIGFILTFAVIIIAQLESQLISKSLLQIFDMIALFIQTSFGSALF